MNPKLDDNKMPHSLEAEQTILLCVLTEQDVISEVIKTVTESDFYYEKHKMIFRSIKDLYESNVVIDFITLSDYLDKNDLLDKVGLEYLAYLTNFTDNTHNGDFIKYYIDIIKNDGMLRLFIELENGILDKNSEE